MLKWMIGSLFVSLLALAGNLKLHLLHAEFVAAQHTAQRLQQENRQYVAMVLALRQQASRHDQALTALHTQQARIRVTHTHRITRIHAYDEIPALHQWATGHVPDAIVRLHTHPTFTHARDYAQRLSACDRLQAARKRPPHKR